MSSTQVYHLAGKGFSGRGVRVRCLTVSEKDKLLIDALTTYKDEPAAMRVNMASNGVRAMLVAVTRKPVASADDLLPANAEKAGWAPVDLSILIAGGPLAYSELFTGKDDDALHAIYRRNHDASVAEVDSILGKVVEMED